MKDQYFGDENDYRKYGLLRILLSKSEYKLLVVWMLTKNDKRNDGKFRDYLKESEEGKWKDFDKELYKTLFSFPQARAKRSIKNILNTDLLPKATHFPVEVPHEKIERIKWREELLEAAKGKALVFFDPDNGIETTRGTLTEKHLAWEEIKMVWDARCSILIYQHFPRKKHPAYVKDLESKLQTITRSKFIRAFWTSRVLFLLVSQQKHEKYFRKRIENCSLPKEKSEKRVKKWVYLMKSKKKVLIQTFSKT